MNAFNTSLLLADGTVLENCSCGFADKTIWCWTNGLSMADCFSIFSDPTKTNTISCLYMTHGVRYRGFTEMDAIRKSLDSFGNETVNVRLVPVGDNYEIEEFPINNTEEEGGAEENA